MEDIQEWPSCPDFPAHAIVIDHDLQAIILTIRGSITSSDWVTDFDCDYLEYTHSYGDAPPI